MDVQLSMVGTARHDKAAKAPGRLSDAVFPGFEIKRASNLDILSSAIAEKLVVVNPIIAH